MKTINRNRNAAQDARERARDTLYLLRIDSLLLQAGFDPDKIPDELRLPALHVAWAYASGLFDIDDVASACELSYDEACNARDALRVAGRP